MQKKKKQNQKNKTKKQKTTAKSGILLQSVQF